MLFSSVLTRMFKSERDKGGDGNPQSQHLARERRSRCSLDNGNADKPTHGFKNGREDDR